MTYSAIQSFLPDLMLTSFSPTSLQILREHRTPHNFPVEQGHSVSAHKILRDIFLKLFMVDGGKTSWENLLGSCSKGEINDQIMPRTWKFHNAFSSNLKTVNLKISTNLYQFLPMKVYTLEDLALISLQNYGSIYT